MKLTSHSPALLLVAAPLWALSLSSNAQNPAKVPTPPPRSAVALPQDLHAAGTVSAYDATGLTVADPITGSMTVYLTNSDTTFVDTQNRIVAPDRVTLQTPVKVHYTPVGNKVLATKVIVDTTLNTDGTLTEVGPGVLVIQLSAPPSPLRFVTDNTLKFVDHKGKTAPPDAVRQGAQVRVFYTRKGDVLMASKVELLEAGSPAPATTSITTQTTTTTREVKR